MRREDDGVVVLDRRRLGYEELVRYIQTQLMHLESEEEEIRLTSNRSSW